MILPSTDVQLPSGLVWRGKEIEPAIWQAHLVKHVLGVNELRQWGPKAPWNRERWHELGAIDEERRARLVAKIVALRNEKQRCEVPELRGKVAEERSAKLECERCKPPVLHQCGKLLHGDQISQRYAAVTEAALRALVGGALMQRAALTKILYSATRSPERCTLLRSELVVMSSGRDNAGPIVRVCRSDGVRVDLYRAGSSLSWRTTLRNQQALEGLGWVSHVLDAPAKDAKLSLSEEYVVPRDWFNRHGT